MKNNLSSWFFNQEKIILLDNGAYEIKHSTANPKKPIKKEHNAKFYEKLYNNEKSYYIEDIKNYPLENLSNINKNYCRPLTRGLLYDIDLQLDIWEEVLSAKHYPQLIENNFSDSLLIFTHTPLAPDEVIEGYFQLIFEYFGFNACIKSIPHVFSALYAKEKYNNEINPTVQLVVDSGFSSTTIVPIFDNRPIFNSIKRINIGGKLLTNYLKESLINTIELDIRKEFFLANLIKEENCFLSKNFNIDMRIASLKGENNIYKKTFILPEYRNRSEEVLKRISKEKYLIELNSLRFIVPELIFNPNVSGIEEGGLHDGINQSIKLCHEDYRNLLFNNIIINGGNTKLPNFKERLENELVPLTDNTKIRIFNFEAQNKEPVIEGMKIFSQNTELLKDIAIYKKDYDELGFNVVWKNCL